MIIDLKIDLIKIIIIPKKSHSINKINFQSVKYIFILHKKYIQQKIKNFSRIDYSILKFLCVIKNIKFEH